MPTVPGHVLLRAVADAPRRRPAGPVQARLRPEALELLRAEPLLEARYCHRFIDVADTGEAGLLVAGEWLDAPWLIPESGTLTAIACCVATLGERLENRIRGLFDARRASLALALDDLGNEALSALACRAQDRMLAVARRQGLSMAGELRPGDPGLALEAQRNVLAWAGAAGIGVSLSAGSVMQPIKSASMVFGVGKDLPAVHWSRCDDCATRERCHAAT